jgi:pimeloyl-ACP methyl ester carboxylesterase
MMPALAPPRRWPGRMVAIGGDREVFVRHAGEGVEPVLCVHGLEGSSTNWTGLMTELAGDGEFALDAVDLPGFGLSGPVPPAGYSITGQARTVAATIEKLYDSPVHLVGNSLGGAVCLRLAAHRPELVRTLTLISAVLPDKWPHWQLARFPLLAVPGVGEWMLRRTARIEPVRRVRATAAFVCYDPAWLSPEQVAEATEEQERRDHLDYADDAAIHSVRALIAEMYGTELWRDAARVRAPTLAIFGSHDRLVDPRLAGRAARILRDPRVLVLPRSGHVAHMEHPAKVAAEVREWTRRTRGLRVHEGRTYRVAATAGRTGRRAFRR